MSNITVIGLGYIGLPTALIMAASGQSVIAVDYNEKLVRDLQSGNPTLFQEDGIDKLYEDAKNNIVFKTDYPSEDFYIIAVPTPYFEETKKIDATYVVSAFSNVLEVCNDNAIIVIESTISPGTIDKKIRPLLEKTEKNVNIAHAPERIIPGSMIKELVNNSRTIGCDRVDIGEKIKEVYASFCKGEIVLTDIKTAEMSKVVENTYRDINIAFANELARICEKGNLDVYEVISVANRHPRVNILQPGPGVGGHCISVDPWFLVGDYPDEAKLIYSARKVNSEMPLYVWERIKNLMSCNDIDNISEVGIYGLTYKEDVDDVRESPTLQLLDFIHKENSGNPIIYDPLVKETIFESQVDSFEEFIKKTKLIVVMVGHKHIKDNASMLEGKIVFDTKNVIDNAIKL